MNLNNDTRTYDMEAISTLQQTLGRSLGSQQSTDGSNVHIVETPLDQPPMLYGRGRAWHVLFQTTPKV